MITYQVSQHFAWKWILISLVLLSISYFAREIDFVRIVSIYGVAVLHFGGIVYAVFFPTLLGDFIRINETKEGFDIEYLNKDGSVKSFKKIVIKEVVNFSNSNHSSKILTQSRIVFRFEKHSVKLTLLHKKKVRGVELQTSEILDKILSEIDAFNSLSKTHFIERTPSLMATKSALYIIVIYVLIFATIILFKIPNTEKKIYGLVLLLLTVILPLRLHFSERAEIRKHKVGHNQNNVL